MPDWFLLAWAGLFASVLAAWLRFAPISEPHRRALHALGDLVIGLILYTPLYGIAFEAVQRSDIGLGLALGTIHGIAIAFILAVRRRARTSPARTATHAIMAHLVFGGALGYLYSVPIS